MSPSRIIVRHSMDVAGRHRSELSLRGSDAHWRDSTTFSAPVSPALENVSYASRKSSKAKRCVTNRPMSSCPYRIRLSKVGWSTRRRAPS